MSHEISQQLYAGLAPWLTLSLLMLGRNPFLSRVRIIAALLLALIMLGIPVPSTGWNGFAWVRVLEPNPSFTLTALLGIALWERISRKRIFRPEDWNAAWIFGTASALLLYPMSLGLTSLDPYGWGWGPRIPILVAVASAMLILRGSRFGILLLLPFAGFLTGLQESTNFWDAVIDPFYAIFSILAVFATTASRSAKSVALASSEGIVNGQSKESPIKPQ
jgi:hypothetical protein